MPPFPQAPNQRRWYDARSNINGSLMMLETLPDPVQVVVSGGVNRIAQKQFGVGHLSSSYKSLGGQKVLALHKSKSQQRKVDRIPQVHQTMNNLLVLEVEGQHELTVAWSEILGYVYQYFQSCHKHASSPNLASIEGLVDTYVDFGRDYVPDYLTREEARMLQIAPSVESGVERPRLADDDGELRLKS